MFNKLIKQQNGSIAVYAIAMVLCFTMILGGIFFSSKVIRTIELKTLSKIKDVYIQDDNPEKIAKIKSDRNLADTSGYVQDESLLVFYDAINNMGSSHSNNTRIWRDLSGNGNDAIYSGSGELTWNDKAYDFIDPANNYFVSKKAISLGSQSRTIEIVCSLEDDGVENIIGFGATSPGALNDIIYYNNGINLNYNNTDMRNEISDSALKLGKTYSNTITYNSTSKILNYYTDAEKQEDVSVESALNTSSSKLQIGIGINTGHNQERRLKIQAIRIYNRVLTEEDININYELDKARYEVKEELVIKKGVLIPESAKYMEYSDDTSSEPVPIPGGYGVVKDSITDTDSIRKVNTIASGLVISDLAGDTLDNEPNAEGVRGNQFVWVPVSDITSMYDETNTAGKLYDFGTKSLPKVTPKSYPGKNKGNREPDIITANNSGTGTSYDGLATFYKNILELNSSAEFATELQDKFNEMIESVKKYKGFYIGRYETGNLKEDKENVPVVQKGNSVLGNANWYYMYQTSKKIAKNKNVISSMIWGCQWDRTLNWFIETEKAMEEIVDSTTWGNYKDSTGAAETSSKNLQPSGTNMAWQKKHIYDLAGNVWEWTIEADGIRYRVDRGGSYAYSGGDYPASKRDHNNPNAKDISQRFTSYALYK